MLRVYIAGPITGMQEYNVPAFAHAADLWRKAGWEVVNPVELDDGDHSKDWLWYMRRDIPHLVQCDAIALLPGWSDSRGAHIENEIMDMLNLPSFSALSPAPYTQHDFINPGNICCLLPDYVHESLWRQNHGR